MCSTTFVCFFVCSNCCKYIVYRVFLSACLVSYWVWQKLHFVASTKSCVTVIPNMLNRLRLSCLYCFIIIWHGICVCMCTRVFFSASDRNSKFSRGGGVLRPIGKDHDEFPVSSFYNAVFTFKLWYLRLWKTMILWHMQCFGREVFWMWVELRWFIGFCHNLNRRRHFQQGLLGYKLHCMTASIV